MIRITRNLTRLSRLMSVFKCSRTRTSFIKAKHRRLFGTPSVLLCCDDHVERRRETRMRIKPTEENAYSDLAIYQVLEDKNKLCKASKRSFLTLFFPPPPPLLQVFPCCAETVCSRLMKLSDFQYNYVGHHLK